MKDGKMEVLPPAGQTGIASVDQILPLLAPEVGTVFVSLCTAIAENRREMKKLANDLEKIQRKHQIFRDGMTSDLVKSRMNLEAAQSALKSAERLSIKFNNPSFYKEALKLLRDYTQSNPDFTGKAIEAMSKMDD